MMFRGFTQTRRDIRTLNTFSSTYLYSNVQFVNVTMWRLDGDVHRYSCLLELHLLSTNTPGHSDFNSIQSKISSFQWTDWATSTSVALVPWYTSELCVTVTQIGQAPVTELIWWRERHTLLTLLSGIIYLQCEFLNCWQEGRKRSVTRSVTHIKHLTPTHEK